MLRKMSHLGSRQAWQTPLLLTYEDRQNEGWQSGSEFPKSLATPPANQAEAQLSHELMSPSGTHIHSLSAVGSVALGTGTCPPPGNSGGYLLGSMAQVLISRPEDVEFTDSGPNGPWHVPLKTAAARR